MRLRSSAEPETVATTDLNRVATVAGMDSGAVARIDLGDAVAERLRTSILAGELAPGTRLVETALAESFGTSRGPVRDAIVRLAATGLVTVTPRRGAYVTELGADDIDEIYTLRAALETAAARRAATHATPADLAAMDDAVRDLAKVQRGRRSAAVGEADMRFHRCLVRAAHHGRLAHAWEAFADQTLLLLTELSGAGSRAQAAIGGHADILAAVRSQDAATAQALLAEHLDMARTVMLERFAHHAG